MSASERSNLSTPEAAVREDGAAVPEARFSSQMLDLLLLYTNIEGNALSKQVRRRQLCAGSWSALLCHVLSSRSQVSIALALGRVQIVLIVIGLIGLIVGGVRKRWAKQLQQDGHDERSARASSARGRVARRH